MLTDQLEIDAHRTSEVLADSGARTPERTGPGRASTHRTLLGIVVAILSVLLVSESGAAPRSTSSRAASSGDVVSNAGAGVISLQKLGKNCTCEANFSGKGIVSVPSCDAYSESTCGIRVTLPAGGGSGEFKGCECTCITGWTDDFQEISRSETDGLFIRGVPDFWQFPYKCEVANRANKVGCGPVAMTALLHWYGSRGYPELVADHFVPDIFTPLGYELAKIAAAADGITEPNTWHAWQEMTKDLRDDASGGICIGRTWVGGDRGQYAMTENDFVDGIKDFASSRGVTFDIEVHKIREKNSDIGLDVIKEELRAGRPLAIRFNSSRAEETFVHDTSTNETIFTGELSNNTWYNDHYGVITGFRRSLGGRDVIYINSGTGDTFGFISSRLEGADQPGISVTNELAEITGTNQAYEWNPTGKWVRLYEIRPVSEDDGSSDCESAWSVQDPGYHPKHGSVSSTEIGTTPTTVGFSHFTEHSTVTGQDGIRRPKDWCGAVRDLLKTRRPTWNTETIECREEPKRGTFSPKGTSAQPRGSLSF